MMQHDFTPNLYDFLFFLDATAFFQCQHVIEVYIMKAPKLDEFVFYLRSAVLSTIVYKCNIHIE